MDQYVNVRRRAAHAAQSVVDMLETKITSGEWSPGTQLPTERALEVEFGVARNTLRKRLKQLELEGKIVRQVGRGAFVADATKADQRSNPFFDLSDCSPADVLEVRLMLEPRAAELAANRASLAELRFMSECLASAAQAVKIPEFEHWDGMLHKAIIDAARNDLLTRLYGAINAVRNQSAWKALKERTVTPERRAKFEAEHGAIVTALQERDGRRAHDTMRSHLVNVRASMMGE